VVSIFVLPPIFYHFDGGGAVVSQRFHCALLEQIHLDLIIHLNFKLAGELLCI